MGTVVEDSYGLMLAPLIRVKVPKCLPQRKIASTEFVCEKRNTCLMSDTILP